MLDQQQHAGKLILTGILLLCISLVSQGQKVHETFLSNRSAFFHTVETVDKGFMNFRVSHSFGDLAGDNGGFHNFYGLDNLANVRIGLEYGITENLSGGLARNKGAAIPELFDSYLKYRLLYQNKSRQIPVSVTLLGSAGMSAAQASQNPESRLAFRRFPHRLNYVTQLLIARKFSDRLSWQLMPAYSHRNLVLQQENNQLFALGTSGYFRLSKMISLTASGYYPFRDNTTMEEIPLSLGTEIKTGGHVFQVYLTNTRGLIANETIPYTQASVENGAFRFGFSIKRPFRIAPKTSSE